MARREPTKSRRNPYREPRPRLLVVCGAARTEEQYVRGLRDSTACNRAREESIHLAVSNPCFEFWLLLHHENHRGHLTRCAAAEEKLRRFVPGYDKTQLVFSDFAGGVSDARERAKDIDAKPESPRPNPSSGMWRLIQSMAGEERTGDG